jgi:DNA-binding MarR family transcriptional regulator
VEIRALPERFGIEDGWVTEADIRNLSFWYNQYCPETSAATFEAHLMVLRAYVTLVSGPPIPGAPGLTRAKYNLLRMLYQAEGNHMLIGDFADGLNVSPTNISKLVDSLVADGFVRRTPHEIDRRKTWAELTEEGRELIEAVLPTIAQGVEETWAGLDDEEKRVLAHLLAKMRMHALANSENKTLSVIRRISVARNADE